MTRHDSTMAGIAALTSGGLLTVSLVLTGSGPAAYNGSSILRWFSERATQAQAASLLWLASMLFLVLFAVRFREAMLVTILDRSWVTVVFLQGAGVFAAIAVVSAALGWTLADLAQTGNMSPDAAVVLWAMMRALMRFAAWGLVAPLAVMAIALHRHSTLGEVCAVGGIVVAVLLLIPATAMAALAGFAGWLFLVGFTLVVPRKWTGSPPPMYADENVLPMDDRIR